MMIPYLFTLVMQWWRWVCGAKRTPANSWLVRPHLAALAQADPATLPAFVQESTAAQTYLTLFGPLDWGRFPERPTNRLWPGPDPLPRAALVAAYLLKLDKGLKSMKKLRDALVEQPALVWLFGFPLVPSTAYRWGFDVERSVPTPRHFSRVLRTLDHAQVVFLFKATVQLLDTELPPACHFGQKISLDTKHILAWVRENNPKAKMPDRYDKARQPRGDRDCKLGCKKRHNVPTHDGSDDTPTQEGLPARQATVGEFYWGYASGVVATKDKEYDEGFPLCAAGLPMPRKNTFIDRSSCLVEHECARYACPLVFPQRTGESCPIHHDNWPKGCITTLPTSPGNRIRHELDRHSEAYTNLYKQRSATERINS